MKLVRQQFIDEMERELNKNGHKGDWGQWKPNKADAMTELRHHVKKLQSALDRDALCAAVTEHCADVSNIAMKIQEVHGA